MLFSYPGKTQKTILLEAISLRDSEGSIFPFVVSIILSLLISPRIFKVSELVGNLLMLQDFETGKPGTIVRNFMGNSPLWSLSYEWWFYMLFPLSARFIQTKQNRGIYIGAISIISLLIYIFLPNHLLLIPFYFLIWWIGVELAFIKKGAISLSWQGFKTIIAMILLVVVILGGECMWYAYTRKPLQIGIYPFLFLRHFIFALIALAFIIATSPLIKNKLVGLITPFKFISPISYSLYIFHYVILVQLNTTLPLGLELPLKITLLLGLCYIVEIKLQPLVNRLIR